MVTTRSQTQRTRPSRRVERAHRRIFCFSRDSISPSHEIYEVNKRFFFPVPVLKKLISEYFEEDQVEKVVQKCRRQGTGLFVEKEKLRMGTIEGTEGYLCDPKAIQNVFLFGSFRTPLLFGNKKCICPIPNTKT
jgi:hypothetical protein